MTTRGLGGGTQIEAYDGILLYNLLFHKKSLNMVRIFFFYKNIPKHGVRDPNFLGICKLNSRKL